MLPMTLLVDTDQRDTAVRRCKSVQRFEGQQAQHVKQSATKRVSAIS